MKGIIKKYYKEFLLRGLMVCAFGPIVLAIIYGILGACGVIDSLSPGTVTLGIITITVLAFLSSGITVVYKIEELPLPIAILLQGVILYIAYAIIYLINGWLKSGIAPFLVFTAIFVAGYLIVWIIVYFCIRNSTDKLNKKLKN